jgi:hypothetical protein
MKLKKLGMALVVICAFGAAMASSALAAAVTEDVPWTIEKTGLVGSETVTSSGSGILISEVGKTSLELNSTGIECVGCKIENTGGVATGSAIGTGKLVFTGVTVTKPATCAVESLPGHVVGQIETVDLKIKADYMIGTSDYVLFEPEEGSKFTEFKLIKGSGSCSIAGTYSITGSDYVKTNNATGVLAVSQEVTSSGTINSEAGGELKLGEKKAELNGTATFALSGANKGKKFGTN